MTVNEMSVDLFDSRVIGSLPIDVYVSHTTVSITHTTNLVRATEIDWLQKKGKFGFVVRCVGQFKKLVSSKLNRTLLSPSMIFGIGLNCDRQHKPDFLSRNNQANADINTGIAYHKILPEANVFSRHYTFLVMERFVYLLVPWLRLYTLNSEKTNSNISVACKNESISANKHNYISYTGKSGAMSDWIYNASAGYAVLFVQ